jgi:hypothetical protein
VQRELSKLEKKERQRLSAEVLAGFLTIEEAKKVIEMKMKLVVIGAAQQVLARIEELLEQQTKLRNLQSPKKLSSKDAEELWYLQHNLRYYKEQVFEYQIKLPNLWAGVEPWTSDQLLRKCWALALRCNAL